MLLWKQDPWPRNENQPLTNSGAVQFSLHDWWYMTIFSSAHSLGTRLTLAAPRRLRWAISRNMNGSSARWVQRTYDAEPPYTLRGMRRTRSVFVHIPKCAGLSINQTIYGDNGGAHASVADYLGVFGSKWYDAAFSFSFVRNPWTRTVSAFEFLRKGGVNRWDAAFAREHLDGHEDVNDFVLRSLGKKTVMDYLHFRDQFSFLRDPRTGKVGVDFVGHFENIDADFARVCAHFSIDAPLFRTNQRNPKQAAPVLCAEAIERIADVYSHDIAIFGYQGDRPFGCS